MFHLLNSFNGFSVFCSMLDILEMLFKHALQDVLLLGGRRDVVLCSSSFTTLPTCSFHGQHFGVLQFSQSLCSRIWVSKDLLRAARIAQRHHWSYTHYSNIYLVYISMLYTLLLSRGSSAAHDITLGMLGITSSWGIPSRQTSLHFHCHA